VLGFASLSGDEDRGLATLGAALHAGADAQGET
jgi:hypothetical protein